MTWPDLDVAPQLRPVGGAGGDRFGAGGADEADVEEDGKQSEQRAGTVHVDGCDPVSENLAAAVCGLNRRRLVTRRTCRGRNARCWLAVCVSFSGGVLDLTCMQANGWHMGHRLYQYSVVALDSVKR